MVPLFIIKASSILPAHDQGWNADVPKIMRARAPRIWCMAYAVVKKLLTDCVTPPESIITATALGALDETKNFLDGVFKDGFGSPRNFIASVHNSMAGKLAMDFKINGPNLTICDGQNSFASALVTASLLSDRDFPVCIVAIEERIELLDTILLHLSEECRRFFTGDWDEAAVAFLLDKRSEPGIPCITAVGPEVTGSLNPAQKCAELARSLTDEDLTVPPPGETSNSFVKPAIIAYDHINNSPPGTYLIGSYSPSALAAAVVKLCV
jgi:hypothetical protein